MEVASTGPLPVGSIVWQAWSGAFVLSVVCKATFRLRSVESPLAEAQDPIVPTDRYWHDDPREALRAPTDLVPFKRRAEVILVGHAYAPHGPARSVLTRLCVAGADKLVDVFSERVFTMEGQLREASPPFVKSPLVWRYAAGGPGTSNPVGIASDATPDPYGQRLIPRFQPPGLHITRPDQVIPTLGYGPIAPTWPERITKLYHHAATWDPLRWNQRPLPRDIDVAYFNAATADQQVDAIRADERIVMENLHPDYPRLVTNLAPVTPEAVVERPGQPAEAVPFVCDTMWIDTDRGVCALTWRARILLDSPNAPGRVLVKANGAVEEAYPVPAAAARVAERTAVAPSVAPAPSVPAPAATTAAAPVAPSPPVTTAAPAGAPDPASIERCAEIAASCALRPGDTAAILQKAGLSEDDWDALEHRWAQVLKKDAEQFRTDRLAAYDGAYVARLEAERGPITPEAYARLALAHARDKGALTRALRDLGLPWGTTARIQRVFAERMAADPALAARVNAAMKEP
jgi:hypothetical protein